MARMAVVLAGLDLDWPLDCLPHISGDVFLALYIIDRRDLQGLSLIMMASLIAETLRVSC